MNRALCLLRLHRWGLMTVEPKPSGSAAYAVARLSVSAVAAKCSTPLITDGASGPGRDEPVRQGTKQVKPVACRVASHPVHP